MYYSRLKPLRIGNLRHRITFQVPITTVNEIGEEVTGYSDFKTVWAAIEPLHGREFEEGNKNSNEVTHRIKIRYTPGLSGDMKIIYKNREFDIQSIINVNERNRELHIMAIERKK